MADYKPEGYHAVSPYLVVRGVDRLLDFTKRVLGAEEKFRMDGPDGIAHAEVVIGDSVVMMGEAPEEPRPGTLYVYVPDVDAAYRRALDAGAKPVEEPENQFWGDRRATVEDPFGNRWTVATMVEQVSPEEMERRVAEMRSQ
jgi:PhnB protein